MKKGIIIGCAVLVLAALAWFGGRKLLGSKDADTVGDSAEVSADAKDTEAEDMDAAASDADVKDTDEAALDAEADEVEPASDETENTESAEEDAAGNETIEDTVQAALDAVEEAVKPSDEGLLYSIKTSTSSNLGMVPIVNGNAVVMMDSGNATTHEGEYAPPEQSAFRLKLEEQTALAASEGKIGEWAFYRESSMNDFVFPEGVNTIEKFAFSRSGLKSVVIPEGVTSIGYGAFYHCDDLSEVTIPDSVTVIEENAFAHTSWLNNWLAGGADKTSEDADGEELSEISDTGDFLIVGDGILLAYRGNEENPEIPPGVKVIAARAFDE